MSSVSGIQTTQLLGGRKSGAACTLLEFSGFRVLLDCGLSSDDAYADLLQLSQDLSLNGGIDAVLLSHADIHHVGALPILFGSKGMMRSVPIICTLPVYKYSQILLYDECLHKQMEGINEKDFYTLDDVDVAFSLVTPLKFSQTVKLADIAAPRPRSYLPDTGESERMLQQNRQKQQSMTVCACPTGRTIGGAAWRIRCGPAEILYALDFNLKREIVLDGLNMELLPTSPDLMIIDASNTIPVLSSSSSSAMAGTSTGKAILSSRKSKKDKDETSAFLDSVMETMRMGGNVLIPCETAGRCLELMQILGKYWYEQKLGMYHLILLSHMAKNVTEFARMQLEWMSDALSRQFYNGRPNPFELPQFKLLQSVRELERYSSSPKVVLCTGPTLSAGMSKQLLLMWGGDPRCKVIFPDGAAPSADPGTLSRDLRDKLSHFHHTQPPPPLICTVTQPVTVELVGVELAEYRQEQERQRRAREETLQRKRRQEELSQFNVQLAEQLDVTDEDDEEEEEDDEGELGEASSAVVSADSKIASKEGPPKKKSKSKSGPSRAGNRLLVPNFEMFECAEIDLEVDDYGASIADLKFRDISTIESRWQARDRVGGDGGKENRAGNRLLTKGVLGYNADGKMSTVDTTTRATTEVAAALALAEEEEEELARTIPTKIITTKSRVQFTCAFREFNISGRADFKAKRTLVKKVNPTRLVVMRGSAADCDAMVTYARSNGIAAFAPGNRTAVNFRVHADRLHVHIPQSMLRANTMKMVYPHNIIAQMQQQQHSSGGFFGNDSGLFFGFGLGVRGGASAAAAGTMTMRGDGAAERTGCQVCALKGRVFDGGLVLKDSHGARIVRFVAADQREEDEDVEEEEEKEGEKEGDAAAAGAVVPGRSVVEIDGEGSAVPMIEWTEKSGALAQPMLQPSGVDAYGGNVSGSIGVGVSMVDEKLKLSTETGMGVVSLGEVNLDTLRQQIEPVGTKVEFRLSSAFGGMLVCDGQVILRRDAGSDFVLEGPPIPAYFAARKVLYQQFAFV